MEDIFLGYVDPGTGSMIWQLLAAFGVGLIFYFRNFFSFLLKPFRKNKKKTEKEGN